MKRATVLLAAILAALAAAGAVSAQASAPRHHKHAHGAVRSHAAQRHAAASRVRAALQRRHARRASAAPAGAAPPTALVHARAAAIASVLATPCQNTQLVPEAANLQLVREAVLCLINQQRARSGEAPLRENAQLDQAATGHSQEMIAENYFEHIAPSGLTPVARARQSGYLADPEAGYVIGENLAWGTYSLATPQAIVSAWIASPPHLANILEARYADTGVGVVAQTPAVVAGGAPGATYSQEFGVIEG